MLKAFKNILTKSKIGISLHHLQTSSDGSYLDAIYLYRTPMFCISDKNIGKPYIDKIGWRSYDHKLGSMLKSH